MIWLNIEFLVRVLSNIFHSRDNASEIFKIYSLTYLNLLPYTVKSTALLKMIFN